MDTGLRRRRPRAGAVTLTVGSLFSGIGGFDLGLERAGMRVIWQSEIDPYASAVLRKHWPEVPNHGDIRSIRAGTAERPDLICGGFPCQPFSHAGKRRGADDDRHLWPEMCRVIGELRPAWVIGENVAGIISMELDAVLSDLEALGYATRAVVIPAVAVDAPHRRDRVWIIACDRDFDRESACTVDAEASGLPGAVAHARCERDAGRGAARDVAGAAGADQGREKERQRDGDAAGDGGETVADAERSGQSGSRESVNAINSAQAGNRETTQFVNGGGPGFWLSEPDVGRVAHGVPSRVDRLRCLGNAIVPQIAEVIGRAIIASLPLR